MMRLMIAFVGAASVLCGTASIDGVDGGVARAAEMESAKAGKDSSSMPLPLRVVGAQVLNSRDEPVRLRGVNTASLEWTSDGEGHIVETLNTAIRDWKVNHIRLPLSQDRWFGKAPEQTDNGEFYRALVKQIVDTCAEQGVYIILDLHWSDAGEWGKQIGQHVMPDLNSVTFWKDLATTYKNHPAVIFDLYNEPHDVSWHVWLNGGEVTERDRRTRQEKTFEAVGMQPLLDVVRATGARNVVIIGGLDWSYDLSGILDGRQLSDPNGNGLIYANHAYPFKGDTVEEWIAKMEVASKELPLIVSEFGAESRGRGYTGGERWVRTVLQALDDHGWAWTAWDLHPQAGPRLISDWDYTPTPTFGVWVQKSLLGTLPPYTPSAEETEEPEPPPRRRSNSVRLFGVIASIALAQLPEVQEELGLNNEQKEEVTQLNEELSAERSELFQNAAGDFDKLRQDLAKLYARFTEKLNGSLDESQQTRMYEVYVHVNGPVVLSDDAVTRRLELSDEQKHRLEQAAAENHQEVFGAFRELRDMSDEERAKRTQELIQSRDNRLLAILTGEQRQQFEAMKGTALEVDLSNLPGPGR